MNNPTLEEMYLERALNAENKVIEMQYESDKLTDALHRAMWALCQADPATAMKLDKRLIEETGKGRIRPWKIKKEQD